MMARDFNRITIASHVWKNSNRLGAAVKIIKFKFEAHGVSLSRVCDVYVVGEAIYRDRRDELTMEKSKLKIELLISDVEYSVIL